MPSQVLLSAVAQLALMMAVGAAYVLLARRFRILWHPLAIVAAVAIVSIVVAVSGEVLFRANGSGVAATLRRSAIGGLGWGVVIAAVVWVSRRVARAWMKPT
jgi:hypothetical protein